MQTEKNHAGEFLLSEANGDRSREVKTIAAGQVLEAGTVMGVITAGGEYSAYLNTNLDGTEVAAAVLYRAIDTSATGLNAATNALVIIRDAEVSKAMLIGSDAAGDTDLEALGVIVR